MHWKKRLEWGRGRFPPRSSPGSQAGSYATSSAGAQTPHHLKVAMYTKA